jgi:membrane protein required for beta-lactamase induction
MRITWDDDTSVELWFTSKGEAKSAVQVQHTKLASKDDATERKAYWGERLDALGELLEKAK